MPKIGESTEKKQGWAAVARRRAEVEERAEIAKTAVRDFFISTGKTAIIQFLQDEPYCFDSHSVEDKWGNFKKAACQCMTKKRCSMCSENWKKSWSAAFKVLDYRGTWDKEAKEFKYDEKVEKLWVVGTMTAQKLQQISEKRGKELSEMVFEVTNNGKGDYNFEAAFDEDDVKLKPVKWEEELASAEDCCQPPTDEEIDEREYKPYVPAPKPKK